MKILTGAQISQADTATIENEPISSVDLMERTSEAMAREICDIVPQEDKLLFFIGKGNNGGDGLAVARILHNAGFDCSIAMLFAPEELGEDCRFNYERLPEGLPAEPWDGKVPENDDENGTVIVDAILGSGLKGAADGIAAGAIKAINDFQGTVISLDIPSGMPTDPIDGPVGEIVSADYTLTVEFPKLSMLLPATGECCGKIKIIPIDLDSQFIKNAETPYKYITEDLIYCLLKSRPKFAHKGMFGHALMICGSADMFGAAILAVSGALRSGCGLVTAHIPRNLAAAMYTSAPSAMISSSDGADYFTALPKELEKYTVCGCGCGIGKAELSVTAFERLMRAFAKPMVLDADALNMLAVNPALFALIPEGSILTPHPGEFQRLVGKWNGEAEKLSKLRSLAVELKSVIVLKGAFTAVCTPQGSIYFNPTGTPGMATGGSGDVLTGFITGLLARGYTAEEAAVVGVYLHGKGGEKAAEYYGVESMNSADLPDFIAEAYNEILSACS